MNLADYFSETPKDIFGGCSICVNQFMSGNRFLSICSTLKFTANHTMIIDGNYRVIYLFYHINSNLPLC